MIEVLYECCLINVNYCYLQLLLPSVTVTFSYCYLARLQLILKLF